MDTLTLYARLEDERVVELYETELNISDLFHPSLKWISVEGVEGVRQGWSATEVDGVMVVEEYLPIVSVTELITAIRAERDVLMVTAKEATLGMSDAYIAGLLTTEEELTYKAWAKYKLDLGKLEKQAGYPTMVSWPNQPTI